MIGGLCVAAHGYVRATKDVDVVPRPDRENRRRLYDARDSLGARPVELDDFRPDELLVPFAAEGLDEGGNWALATTAGRVDVMQWIPGAPEYEPLRARALEVKLAGVGAVAFAGYDDLVAMKREAGRPQDELDLQALEQARRRAGAARAE